MKRTNHLPRGAFFLLWCLFFFSPVTSYGTLHDDPHGILEEAYNKGVTNWWGYSVLLLREGKDRGGEEGLRLMEFTPRLTPDLPAAHIETALYRWQLRPWEFYTPLRGYFEGGRALLRNPPLLVVHGLELLYLLSLAVVVSTAILSAVLLFKALPLFMRAGPAGRALRITLLGMPLLLRVSLPWVLLLWGVFLWPYVRKGAKVALVIALVALTYLPSFTGELSRRLAGETGVTLFDLYEMNYGIREKALWDRLLESEKRGFDRDLYLTLAVGYKREGNYQEAEGRLRSLLSRLPGDADAWCNLGNVLLIEGMVEEAIKAYRKAISYRPNEGIYYYNLSKALMQHSIFFLPEASAAFRKATDLAPKEIALQLQRESPHPNRFLLDAPLRRGEILSRGLKDLWQQGMMELIWGVWLQDLSPRLPYVHPLAILGLVILLILLRPTASQRRCAMCGRIFSGLYSQREGTKAICLRCATVLRGREKDLPAREETVRRIKAFARSEGRILRVMLHLPGMAHLWEGYYLSGWFLSLLASTAVLAMSYPHGVLPHPYLPEPGFPAALPLWGLLLIGLYWGARRDALRREHKEVLKPPFYVGI